jgi:hypothetical protein
VSIPRLADTLSIDRMIQSVAASIVVEADVP